MFEGGRLETLQSDKDLMYMCSQVAVQIRVDELVYDLIGEISSDDEYDELDPLEHYLLSDSQGMARTKQTGRKSSPPKSSRVSAGGLPLATINQDSQDSIEAAADLLSSDNMSSPRKSPRKRKNASTGLTSTESEQDTQGDTQDTEEDSEPARKRGRGYVIVGVQQEAIANLSLLQNSLERTSPPNNLSRRRHEGGNL